MTAELPGVGRPPRRRLRVGALVTALTATFTPLCCGGGTAAFFLTNPGGDDPSLVSDEQACGENHRIDVSGRMPRMADYGDSQLRNAAVIIKVGQEMKVPPRGWVIAVATAMQES